MTADPVRDIARAVLYEGYLLWPYRRSALKNQQRFTFGGVHPRAFAESSGDRHAIRMECVLRAGQAAAIEIELRFLHLAAVGDWEEAIERELLLDRVPLERLRSGVSRDVEVAAGQDVDERDGRSVAREWGELRGTLEASAEPLFGDLHRLSVCFRNRSASRAGGRPEALRHTFLSTHVVARASAASFVSQTDPPQPLADAAGACVNEGVWPVLVGERGATDTVLGSPIILSDYPQVAPESPGDLFDGGEIDALLIHSIRGLTDAERAEMAATDPRAREILERSMALSPEKMLELYGGAVRELRRVDD